MSFFFGALLAACSGQSGETAPPSDAVEPVLAADEVQAIMEHAAAALDADLFVAVADRRGAVLGVGTNFSGGFDFAGECLAYDCPLEETPPDSDCASVELALQLARTAAFFSADQTPLTSRSVRFLSGEHFPPRVMNTAAAALFGIENTNRGCSLDAEERLLESLMPRPRSLAGTLLGLPCENGDDPEARCGCARAIATLPGGVPIYKNGRMAGGAGVAIRGVRLEPDPVASFEEARGFLAAGEKLLRINDGDPAFARAELAARAFAGEPLAIPGIARKGLVNVCDGAAPPVCCSAQPACVLGVLPFERPAPFDPVIFVDGVEIPFVESDPDTPGPGGAARSLGDLIVDPFATAAQPVPAGWLFGPIGATDSPPGAPPLGAGEVREIIEAGISEADRLRAAIRLPNAARTQMVLAVSDTNNVLLGLFRMTDATVFSIDVAVAKSRNVAYFSGAGIDPADSMDCPGLGDCRQQAFPPPTAITNRTLGFSAQPFFPSGIEASLGGFPSPFAPGPFRRIFIEDSLMPCTNGRQPADGRQNGIVFFPGSAPLYRDGVLVGGLGVSGDGVEQDDLVTFAASAAAPGFAAPAELRADRVFVRGVRLPYFKFNRRPEQ